MDFTAVDKKCPAQLKSETFTLPNVDSAKSNSPVPVLGYQFKAHSLSQY